MEQLNNLTPRGKLTPPRVKYPINTVPTVDQCPPTKAHNTIQDPKASYHDAKASYHDAMKSIYKTSKQKY
jgi:hypothetical protein